MRVISLHLSLISILRRNSLGFAGSTGVSLTGKKLSYLIFSLWNGVYLGTPGWMCLVLGLEVDITEQFMPTGWQAGY